jgi:hypothetical protein
MAEVLLAMMLGLMIVGAGAMMFTTVVRSQAGLNGRDQSIRQGRLTMERLIREIRQGGTIAGTPTAQTLSFTTMVAGSTTCVGGPSDQNVHKPCVVTYSCAGDTCTRREQNPYTGAQGSAVPLVSGLASPNVFEYRTDPTAECAEPPTASNEAISIRDEATLRNSGPQAPSRLCVSLVFKK